MTSLVEIVGIILGSSVLTVVIGKLFEAKQTKAGTIKLKNESGQIVLEGEIKVTEFYKKELENILLKHELLEKRFNEEVSHHAECQTQIKELQGKYTDLQRQFTLLKTQINGG